MYQVSCRVGEEYNQCMSCTKSVTEGEEYNQCMSCTLKSKEEYCLQVPRELLLVVHFVVVWVRADAALDSTSY